MLEAISALDTAVLLFIQEHIRCGALDFIMLFFTRLGDKGAVWLLSGVILFASRQYRKRGFDIIAVVFICGCCSELLKPVFMRPRPFAVMEQMAVLVAAPTTWSFPSGHACAAFAAALAYAKGVKKLAAPAYALAVLISFSRLYVGVHYPTDVIGGLVIGIGCACFARWVATFAAISTRRHPSHLRRPSSPCSNPRRPTAPCGRKSPHTGPSAGTPFRMIWPRFSKGNSIGRRFSENS